MRTNEELKDYYDRELMPALKEVEARRKGVMWSVVAVVVVGFGMMASTLFFMPFGCLAFIPFLLGGLILGGGYHYVTRDYVRDFKANVMAKIIRLVDEGLTYTPSAGIPQSVYAESQIFPRHADRYRCEDRVHGTIGKTAVEFSEVHSEYKTQHRDGKGRSRTEWHTIFWGMFFVADFNKDFKGLTLVLPDTAQSWFGEAIGSFLQSHSIGRPDLVKLEDPEFEKLFVVYGSDQVEARYILSPSLMERMTSYRKKTGRKVHFSFNKSKIYVAVSCEENLFEPRIFGSMMDLALVKKYVDDVKLAVGIVEDLNLNTRIWGKE